MTEEVHGFIENPQAWSEPIAAARRVPSSAKRMSFTMDASELERKTRAYPRTLAGHSGPVNAVALMDGDHVVSGGADMNVCIWDRSSDRLIAVLEGHKDEVTSIAVHGNRIISGSKDTTLRLWSCNTHQHLATLDEHAGHVHAVAATSDAIYSVSADFTLKVWDWNILKCTETVNVDADPISLTASANMLAAGSNDKIIRVWEQTGSKLQQRAELKGHNDRSFCLEFSGNLLFSGSIDDTVRIWDITKQTCLAVLKHNDLVQSLTVCGGILITASADKRIRLWDIECHACIAVLEGHTGRVHSVAVDRTKGVIVSGSKDHTIRLWNISPHHSLKHLHGHEGGAYGIAIFPNTVATAGEDGIIRLWSAKTYQRLGEMQGHTKRIQRLCPLKDRLVSCSKDTTVRVWDLNTRQCVKTLTAHTKTVSEVDARDDIFASAGLDGTLCVWDARTYECLQMYREHGEEELLSVTIGADRIYAGSFDGNTHVWDRQTYDCTAVLEGHTKAVSSIEVNDELIATSSHDSTVRLWDTETYVCLDVLRGHTFSIMGAALLDNALLTAGGDNTIKVWGLDSRECIATLNGGSDFINNVAAQGENTLLSASDDSEVQVFDIGDILSKTSLPALPPWGVVGTFDVHRLHANRAMEKKHIRCALQRFPLTLTHSRLPIEYEHQAHLVPALTWLVASSDRYGLLRIALDVTPLPFLDLSASSPSMVKVAISTKDKCMARRVLDQIVASARAHDTYLNNPRINNTWRLKLSGLGEPLTRDVLEVLGTFPVLAVSFLQSIGSLRSNTDWGYDHAETRLPAEGFVVAGHSEPAPATFWRDRDQTVHLTRDNGTPPVLTEARVVPLLNAAGPTQEREESFLGRVTSSGRVELFNSLTVRAVVQFKWQTYGARKFAVAALWYVAALALLTALTFILDIDGRSAAALLESGAPRDISSVVVAGMIGLLSIRDLLHEYRQARRLGAGHFLDIWNWVHLMHFTLGLVVSATYLGGWQHTRAFLAVAVYVKWFGILFYLQPTQSFGPLVRMILAMCYDVRHFVMVLAISIVGAWCTTRLLLLDPGDALVNPSHGLMLTFSWLLLGELDVETLSGPYSVLARLIMVISIMIVPLVLLNLLIAIMTESYARIQEHADLEFGRLRANIILEQEMFMSDKEKARPDWFPKWLHVLVPHTNTNVETSSREWHGVVGTIRADLKRHTQNVEENINVLWERLWALKADDVDAGDGDRGLLDASRGGTMTAHGGARSKRRRSSVAVARASPWSAVASAVRGRRLAKAATAAGAAANTSRHRATQPAPATTAVDETTVKRHVDAVGQDLGKRVDSLEQRLEGMHSAIAELTTLLRQRDQ